MGAPRATTIGRENVIAIKQNVTPAIIKLWDVSSPDALIRFGPILLRVSAPLMLSKASLKRLVAIWIHIAERRIEIRSIKSDSYDKELAKKLPKSIGIIAAGKVFGLAAKKIEE